MFNDALKEVTGLLDRRFLLNVFFPCLVFCGLLTVVGVIGAGEDLLKLAAAWSKQEAGVQILQVVGFLSIITVFSGILDSQLPAIIRFYEGYSLLPPIAATGKAFHTHRLAQLGKEEAKHYSYLQSYYPSHYQPKQVMPTQFGNILKNSERYPSDRYGLDAIVIWSRLYHLFPDRFIQTIAEAKGSVDFMLVISTLSGSFALCSGSYLLLVKAAWWLFLLCFWGGLAIAWLAYRGALASAVLYAQQIKTGFDLYRHELFKQMHLKLPHSLKDEQEQWKKVNQFLYQNLPLLPDYTDEVASADNPKKEKS